MEFKKSPDDFTFKDGKFKLENSFENDENAS
jgi:hypothetical protein